MKNKNINVIVFYAASCSPTLFTEVAMETRRTGAASADVVTVSAVKAYAGVSAAVTIVTWRALFTTDRKEKWSDEKVSFLLWDIKMCWVFNQFNFSFNKLNQLIRPFI